jgi:hypothetical protein
MPTQLARESAAQGGQECSLRPRQAGFDLTARHRDFLAQDQALDVLGAVLRASDPSQPNTVTEIKYSSRNSTAHDHVMLTLE